MEHGVQPWESHWPLASRHSLQGIKSNTTNKSKKYGHNINLPNKYHKYTINIQYQNTRKLPEIYHKTARNTHFADFSNGSCVTLTFRLVGGAQPSQLDGNLHLHHPKWVGFFGFTTWKMCISYIYICLLWFSIYYYIYMRYIYISVYYIYILYAIYIYTQR